MFESDADRLAMLQAVGAETVLVDNVSVTAVFVDAHTPVSLGEHFIDSDEPQILGRTSDLKSATSSSVVQRGAKAYGIDSIQPDGTGMTTIRLREI